MQPRIEVRVWCTTNSRVRPFLDAKHASCLGRRLVLADIWCPEGVTHHLEYRVVYPEVAPLESRPKLAHLEVRIGWALHGVSGAGVWRQAEHAHQLAKRADQENAIYGEGTAWLQYRVVYEEED